MLLPLSRGREFPEPKAAGVACRNLAEDHRCRIHAELTDRGWLGCVEFDCFGAGQQVTQVTFGGSVADADPAVLAQAFSVLRALWEIRFLLADPACAASSYAASAAALDRELADLGATEPVVLARVAVDEVRGRAGALFARVAAQRGGVSHRGAVLIRANLRDADLTDADLLGADLRDADLRGADLSGALFVTRPQVSAARGDRRTRLPARLDPPPHWLSPPG